MFARTSSIGHICLRCHRRLAQESFPNTASKWLARVRVSGHRMSTATAPIEEDDDYQQFPETVDPSIEQLDNGENKPRRMFRDKIWKPRPTANLGMNSLGSPAEVLILPSRDRRIPIVPDEDTEKPRERLYESLASEKQPLTWEQLKENIENARKELGQQRGQLDEMQSRMLRKNLSERFKTSQLRRYIAKMQHVIPEDQKLPNWTRRKTLFYVRFIAEELWGYTLHGSITAGQGTNDKLTVTIRDKKRLLEVLLRDPNQQYVNIQKQNNVEMNFNREEHKITISGEPDMVRKARSQLTSLTNSVKITELKRQDLPSQLFEPHNLESTKSFIESLGLRYNVATSVGKEQQLVIKHLDLPQEDIQNFRRDIQLSVHTDTRAHAFGLWPTQSLKKSFTAPFQPSSQLSLSETKARWVRNIQLDSSERSETAHGRLGTQEKEMFENTARSIGGFFQEELMPWPMETVNSSRYEFSATFGQVIYNQTANDGTTTNTTDPSERTNSMLIGNVPFLAQYLAARNSPSEGSQYDILDSQLVFRLLLAPSHRQTHAPSFEITLLGEDRQLGLDQPLRIARISAIQEEKIYRLLIPSNVVDIEYTRQLKRDLHLQTSNQPSSNPDLLKQISAYLNTAKNTTSPTFAPFFTFQIPSDLIHHRSKEVEQKSKKSPRKESIEYILQRAENMDIAAYQPALKSKFVLQDIIYHGGQWGPDRHEFKLAELPLLYPAWPRKTKFNKFFHAAMDVVASLGRLG